MTAGSIAVPTIVPLRPPIPGKSKLSVDSNTKVELSTETLGAKIYYTINGTKPDPFPKVGIATYTMEYQSPFTLPAGKQTVKALAMSRDGMRESNVVTKVFEVQYVAPPDLPPEDDDLEFREDLEKQRTLLNVKRAEKNLLLSQKTAWTDVSHRKDGEIRGSNYRRPGTGTRYLNSRQDRSPDRHDILSSRSNRTLSPHRARQLPDNTTQAMRLQRETDFLKCVYCFADRPSDPYARFCHTCGNSVPPIPQTRVPPPEPGQMGTCVYCKSTVPFNTSSCVVCEGPIPNQNQPQASIKLSDKLVCTLCGTANPANLSLCLTCDTRLPTTTQQKTLSFPLSAPPISSLDKKYLKCTKCNRVNRGEARFCDWCGSKPAMTAAALTCSKCRASNHPYASFCGSCGIKIDAPFRVDNVSGMHSVEAQWLPVSTPLGMPPKPSNTIATQTVGLFYPSTRGMEKEKEKEEEKMAFEKQMRDRRPLLTAVSPGKGYWRKQVEHISQHIKAHAQNDAEFRALIGEPKMGKLLTTTVQEDGYELSLTVTFALRGGKDKFTGKKLGITGDYLSFHTDDNQTTYRSDSDDYDEVIEDVPRKGPKKVVKKRKPVSKVSKQDQLLLKEIGQNGDGDPTEVQQLLDESDLKNKLKFSTEVYEFAGIAIQGSDPNCVNKNGIPVLHIAAKCKRAECIPVLVDGGAEVDKKGPAAIKGNTALHEAVGLGPSGAKVVDALLSAGANQNIKNDKGDSAYDQAVKGGYENIVKKFAAVLGQSQLDKMIRPKNKGY